MVDDEYRRSLGLDDDIRDSNGDIGFFEEQEGFQRDKNREGILSKLLEIELGKYREEFEDGAYVTAQYSKDGGLSEVDENYDWIMDITAVSSNESISVSQHLKAQVDRYAEELAEETDADLL